MPSVFLLCTGNKTLLTVNNLSKSYGLEKVLHQVSFNLNPGERLGLVGPNGSGKSTLLRILAGLELPDSGSFHFHPPSMTIGYLPQGLQVSPAETIGSYLDTGSRHLALLAERLEKSAQALARFPQDPAIQEQYDQEVRLYGEGVRYSGDRQAILAKFGLDQLPLEQEVGKLSGGQKTRLALAGVLISNPQLLLLDEPTNHLDLDMLTWLEEWLSSTAADRRSGMLIVSHDRAFLDATVYGILEVDPRSHSIRPYPGGFSDYLAAKQRELENLWQEYQDQQEELVRLESAARHLRSLARFRRGGKADGGDKFARGFFADRSKGTIARSKSLERRRQRLLEEDKVEKPRPDWQLAVHFQGVPESGKEVVLLDNLSIGYPGRLLAENINQILRQGERLALVGPNGSGKTTLLRTITGEIPPAAGRARTGPSIKTGYLAQNQETLEHGLNPYQTIQKIASLSETEARAFLHKFLFSGEEVFVPNELLSFGQRTRLMLACLVASQCNLLLLDEPVNHLDIPSRLRFEQALHTYVGTIIAVAHDRYFIDAFATAIWELRDGKLTVLS